MYLQLFDKVELFDREFSVLIVNFFILQMQQKERAYFRDVYVAKDFGHTEYDPLFGFMWRFIIWAV